MSGPPEAATDSAPLRLWAGDEVGRSVALRSVALRAAAIPVGLIGQLIVARVGGSALLADTSVAISIIGLLATLMAAGLPTVANRLLAERSEAEWTSVASGLARRVGAISCAVAAVFLVVGSPLSTWLELDASWTLRLVIAASALFAAQIALVAGLARGASDAWLATSAESIWSSFGPTIAMLSLAACGLLTDLDKVLIGRAAATGASAAILVMWWRSTLRRDDDRTVTVPTIEITGERGGRARHGGATGPLATRFGRPVRRTESPTRDSRIDVSGSLAALMVSLLLLAQTQLSLWWLAAGADDDLTAQFATAVRISAVMLLIPSALFSAHAGVVARLASATRTSPQNRPPLPSNPTRPSQPTPPSEQILASLPTVPSVRSAAVYGLRRQVTHATIATATLSLLLAAVAPTLVRVGWDVPSENVRWTVVLLCAGTLAHVATGPCGHAVTMHGHGGQALAATAVGIGGSLVVMLISPRTPEFAAAAATVGIVSTNVINAANAHRLTGLKLWLLPRPLRLRRNPTPR